MPRLRDPVLGGAGAGAVLLLVLVLPVVALLLRRRWRLASARREEVMRLVLLASEEAARAELESALACASESSSSSFSGGTVGQLQCVVCYSPTTTRCSRCKAVRYCSGICQIIHWRQGHKEECHPPQVSNHNNGQETLSNLNGTQAEQIEMCHNSSEVEGKACAIAFESISKRPVSSESNRSSEIFSEDDNLEDKSLVDSSGTESSSDSFTVSMSSSSSSISCTLSRPLEIYDDGSVSRDPIIAHGVRLEVPSSSDNSSGSPTREADIGDTNLTEFLPSEINSVSTSVNSISCSSNFKQKVSSCNDEGVGSVSHSCSNTASPASCTSIKPSEDTGKSQDVTLDSNVAQGANDSYHPELYQQVDHIQLDTLSSLQNSSKLYGQAIPFYTRTGSGSSCGAAPSEPAALPNLGNKPESIFDKSSYVPDGRGKDASLLNYRGSKCPSAAPADHNTSTGGEWFTPSATSGMVDRLLSDSTRLSQSLYSGPNGVNDFKTSVERVLQRCKSYKHSRHYPSGKNNDKILFPYDLFIKLYNCEKVELRPFGLRNCGNSCYANAVLQCLAFTRPLTAYLLEGHHTKTCSKKKWCFTCEFESLILKAKQGKSPISPIGILSHIDNIGSNLGRGREEDAHEFLRYAIDAMQSACLEEAKLDTASHLGEGTTLIQQTFGGYLRSKIKCMRCHGKSEQHERMMDVTVEIHGDIGTLEEALARFTTTEILDGENKYQCDRCKSYVKAKKKLTILEAPNVLTIVLKRFQSGKFGKLNKAIRFPEYLDLAPYMSRTDDKCPVYRLHAVVVHLDIMNAAFSGHYVCYVKNANGKWYKIDDSVVKPVELDSVLSKGAYLLLYARCSPRAPSLIRKAVSYDHKSTKNKGHETPCGHAGVPNSRTSLTISSRGSSAAHRRNLSYSHRTADAISRFKPLDFNEKFLHPRADSSSDSSSLLSCSDEGSWSTESTRDSTSTEEYSEYIFGESGTWNSPLRFSEDSDGFASPLSFKHSDLFRCNESTLDFRSSSLKDPFKKKGLSYDADMEVQNFRDGKSREGREVGLQGNGSPPILYADTIRHSRKLTEQCSNRETNRVNNPYGVKSFVTMRRPGCERTTQTFYR